MASDTYPLALVYVADGKTEWRCAACAEGLKVFPGPPGQSRMADGWCRCCFWNKPSCTHRISEVLAPAPKPAAAKPPKLDKRTCVHCGERIGHEIPVATTWGPGHKVCVDRWTERQATP